MVGCVRVVLCLHAEAGVLRVAVAVLASVCDVEEVTRVELHARLIRVPGHLDARVGVVHAKTRSSRCQSRGGSR